MTSRAGDFAEWHEVQDEGGQLQCGDIVAILWRRTLDGNSPYFRSSGMKIRDFEGFWGVCGDIVEILWRYCGDIVEILWGHWRYCGDVLWTEILDISGPQA